MAWASFDPAYMHAYNNRGVALCTAQRFEEAVASYNKAVALNPYFVEAYFNRGIALTWWKRPMIAVRRDERGSAELETLVRRARQL